MKGFGIAGIIFCLAGLLCIILGIIFTRNGGSNIPYIPITMALSCIGVVFLILRWYSIGKRRQK